MRNSVSQLVPWTILNKTMSSKIPDHCVLGFKIIKVIFKGKLWGTFEHYIFYYLLIWYWSSISTPNTNFRLKIAFEKKIRKN